MTHLTPAQKDFIKKKFLEFTDKELARILGVHKRLVQKTMKSQGLYRDKQQKKQLLNRRIPQGSKEGAKNRASNLGFILLLVILGVITYANSFGNNFVWDDEFLITNNFLIKSLSNFKQLFKTTLWAGVGLPTNGYRPLQMLTNTLDYSIWKLNPFGYHLTNLLFHLGAAILMYLITLRIVKHNLFAFFVSSIFLLHPLQTEAVTYISGRAEPLSLFFMLFSILFFIKFLTDLKRPVIFYFISLLSFALSLFSKEASIILPFLLILFVISFYSENFPSKGFISIVLLGFFLIALAFIAIRNSVVTEMVDKDILQKQAMQMALDKNGSPSLYLRILTTLLTFPIYLRLLFLPYGLHMEWKLKQAASILEPRVIGALFLFAAIIFLLLALKKKKKSIAFFGLGWFLICLIPSSNIVPLNAVISEHWLYIPSFGFSLAIVYAIFSLLKRIEKNILKKAVYIFLIFAIGIFSFLSMRRNMDWKNTLTIHLATLKYSPTSTRALNNVAKFHQEKGELEKAKEYYKKALEVDPAYVESNNNLGVIYLNEGKLDQAQKFFEQALKYRSYSPSTNNNLGILYMKKKEYQRANDSFQQALKINPNQAITWANLGDLNKLLEKKGEAEGMYKRAIEIDPKYAYAYNQLIALYISEGKKEEAKGVLNKAENLDLKGLFSFKIE